MVYAPAQGDGASVSLLTPLTTPAAATVANTYPVPTNVAAACLAANASRKFASVYNDGAVTVYIRADGVAATVAAQALVPGAYYYIEATSGIINRNAISAITAAGVGSLAVEEWI